jgi:hypothetical protein
MGQFAVATYKIEPRIVALTTVNPNTIADREDEVKFKGAFESFAFESLWYLQNWRLLLF